MRGSLPASPSVPTASEAATALDGESTALWACQAPGFFGSMKQLMNCARCGEGLKGDPHTPRRYRDTFKPTAHVICDPCYEQLPAGLPPPSAKRRMGTKRQSREVSSKTQIQREKQDERDT